MRKDEPGFEITEWYHLQSVSEGNVLFELIRLKINHLFTGDPRLIKSDEI